jgi:hypothetical protein
MEALMQIKVIDLKNKQRLDILLYKKGQPAQYRTRSGQKLTIEIDGEKLLAEAIQIRGDVDGPKQHYQLIKKGTNLRVLSLDGQDVLLDLIDFYDSSDVVLTGDQWIWTSDTPLQQQSEGVVAWIISPEEAALAVAPVIAAATTTTGFVGLLGGIGCRVSHPK